ncbi:MAG: radical SAM protein [Acutalibacteraceae bacterium]
MKNIYFVQASHMLYQSVYLPYAVGAIAAYSFQYEDIREHYHLGQFIFQQLPVQDIIRDLEDPYMVAFSSYVWNVEFNLRLAQAVKQKWPECIIVFGGPQVSEDMSLLNENAFVDILSFGEGEETTCNLLRALRDADDLSTVHNIAFRDGDTLRKTPRSMPTSLENYPSPYILGYFDSILEDPQYQGIQFDTVLETNRGCPYSCIYCYWGHGHKKVLKFPEEKVKGEILWMAKHSICYCYCADSNFGMFDRDEMFADYMIELKKQYGYPQKFESQATKNKDERTMRINKKMRAANLNKAVTIAVQAMSPKVLKAIGRENMGIKDIESLYRSYRQSGISTYTDLILGFPEETLESFCHGLFQVIESGQHNLINVFRCELLPNSPYSSKEMIEKYNVRTIRSHLCLNHGKVSTGIGPGSRSEIVVSTNTMSVEEWEKALRISICVQSFHCLGLLRYVAVYLRKARDISYKDFYLSLYQWIETESHYIKKNFDYVCASIKPFLAEESDLSFSDPRFGDSYWPFEEGLFLCCVTDIDEFYKEAYSFLNNTYDVDEALEDVMRYQKESISLPEKSQTSFTFLYDWKDYFDNLYDRQYCNPQKRQMDVEFSKPQKKSWAEYARKNLWYGRYMGKTMSKINRVSYPEDLGE